MFYQSINQKKQSTNTITNPHTYPSNHPTTRFTDRAIHDLELASVFRDHPLAVGSALQIPDPGDYFTGNIGRAHPFIVLRDQDRRVRAFYNVCRHKVGCVCLG